MGIWILPFILGVMFTAALAVGFARLRRWGPAFGAAWVSLVAASTSLAAWMIVGLFVTADQKNNVEPMPTWIAVGIPIVVCLITMTGLTRGTVIIRGSYMSWPDAVVIGVATTAGLIAACTIGVQLAPSR